MLGRYVAWHSLFNTGCEKYVSIIDPMNSSNFKWECIVVSSFDAKLGDTPDISLRVLYVTSNT